MVVASGPRLGDVEAGVVATAVSPAFSVVSGGLACIAGAFLVAALIPELARYRAPASTDGGDPSSTGDAPPKRGLAGPARPEPRPSPNDRDRLPGGRRHREEDGWRSLTSGSPSRWSARTARFAPATWDEALDRAAAGFRAAVDAARPERVRDVQLLEGHERDELRRPEVRPGGHRQQQHRQLQPHLTRSQRRRSDDGLRSGGRHQLIRGGRGHRPDHPVGLERARDPPDLLPPRPEGRPRRRRGCSSSIPAAPPSAQWADLWLGLDVGTDIALANAIGREIIHAGLANQTFIERGHHRLRRVPRRRSSRTRSSAAEQVTGVPAEAIRDLAHAYATADRAQLCWTLGITEHHNARRQRARPDQPGAAHRPRRPVRLGSESAARPEQRPGRRRHGRHPEQAPRRPGRRGPRGPGQVRGGVGRRRSRRARLAPLGRCSRRWSAAS